MYIYTHFWCWGATGWMHSTGYTTQYTSQYIVRNARRPTRQATFSRLRTTLRLLQPAKWQMVSVLVQWSAHALLLSEVTTLVLDAIDQLQIAADEIYTRRVFSMNKDGEGMSIQMMHEHNAAAAGRQISNTPDELYLMYALITCQSWWEVSRFVGKDIQLKFCV